MENVQVITGEDGTPAYAVIPWDQYQALTLDEDAIDAALVDAARSDNGESVTAEEMARIIDGVSPITIFRERKAMTQADLADAVDSSAAYISQIETGKRNASKKMQKAIAAALGVTLDDLV